MSGRNRRLAWRTVLKRADEKPTLKEQLAYLKHVEKEDQLYYSNIHDALGGQPTFREKLRTEIKYRQELLRAASREQKPHSEPPTDPLRWLGTQEQLAYLIYLLKEAELIKPGRHRKQAAQSIRDADGEPFKSDQLKSIAGSLGFSSSGSSSTRAKELDGIVSAVKDGDHPPE